MELVYVSRYSDYGKGLTTEEPDFDARLDQQIFLLVQPVN